MATCKVFDQPKMRQGLKKIKGSKRANNNLITFLEELKACKDPAHLGQRKRGRHKYCYGFCLAKSVSLVFRIGYKAYAVCLIDPGDHSRLYGRDIRS